MVKVREIILALWLRRDALADALLSRVRIPALAHDEDGISEYMMVSKRSMMIKVSMVNLASLVEASKVGKVYDLC